MQTLLLTALLTPLLTALLTTLPTPPLTALPTTLLPPLLPVLPYLFDFYLTDTHSPIRHNRQ